MEYRLADVLISEESLRARVTALGREIGRDYAGKEVVAVGVLKGSVIFLADLVRAIGADVEVRLDFIAVSSYGDATKSSGIVKILKDLDVDVKGRHVLIVEDIVDSGLTLSYLRKLLLERSPASVRICALLDKPERRKVDVEIDYSGFAIPDEFVVGYGLDCGERWRQLREILTVRTERSGKEEASL